MNSDKVPASREGGERHDQYDDAGNYVTLNGNVERVITPSGDVIETDDGDGRGSARWVRLAVIIALLVLLAAAIFYAVRGNDEKADAKVDEVQVPVVSVVTPGRTTVTTNIEATGSLAARRPMPIGAVGEGGRVVAVTADAGDWVQQGQLLVAIDRSVQTQQIAAARGQVSAARADAALAQANLSRALKLVERGFISKADIDRLRATRDSAEARVQVAVAQLNELQARTARLNVYAPASGLVLDRTVEVGQTVAPGAALYTIARGGEMEMLARVDENNLQQLSVGRPATVRPVGTDIELSGQIWQLSPMIDEQTREGTARIALSYVPALRPGGFATANITAGQVVAPMLPESALRYDERGSFVMLINSNNEAVRRDVETGVVTNEGVAIIKGLEGTERVVLRSAGFLNPGDKVKPKLVSLPGAKQLAAQEEK